MGGGQKIGEKNTIEVFKKSEKERSEIQKKGKKKRQILITFVPLFSTPTLSTPTFPSRILIT